MRPPNENKTQKAVVNICKSSFLSSAVGERKLGKIGKLKAPFAKLYHYGFTFSIIKYVQVWNYRYIFLHTSLQDAVTGNKSKGNE